jgi:Putative ABC exporter
MHPLVYLLITSTRNRAAAQLRRLRTPRYAIAFVIGGAYVWYFFLRPTSGAGVTSAFLGQATEVLVTMFVVLMLMSPWVFGGSTQVLAFLPAEVAWLFPAPFSRRTLLTYKLLRAQVAVLLNALIWVFILRRGGTEIPGVLRAVAIWTVFTTLLVHRLGAALVRVSWRDHGAAGLRRHRGSIALAILVVGLVAITLAGARAELVAAHGAREFVTALASVLDRAPARYALYPFRLIVAPVFAHTTGAWAVAIGPALLVAALHVVWVLRTDTAFEEAAAEASVVRARRVEALRARRGAAIAESPNRTGARRTLPLAPVGHPAVAVLWKNTLGLMRGRVLAHLVPPFAIGIAGGLSAGGTGRWDPARLVGICAMALAGGLFIMGGRLLRSDLRHDMLNLPMLKSLPIRGRALVLAEVSSTTLPLAAVQIVLIGIAFLALRVSKTSLGAADLRVAALVASPFVVLAVNGAMMTLQNGIAVLFPGWIRLGAAAVGGVEALGQSLLTTVATLIALAMGLVLPAAAGAGVYLALPSRFAVATAAAGIVGAVILAAESYAMIAWFGRVFERTEPQHVV